MLVLVTGGASSGKSALAERLCVSMSRRPLYIATMQPHGGEARARIAKHRAMRSGKGFRTLECTDHLCGLSIPADADGALLEDLGNLVANELFVRACTPPEAARSVLDGLEMLMDRLDSLVLVGNEVFADGCDYPAQTREYIRCLAAVQREAAARAHMVLESVCGLPLVRKGEEWWARCGL